MKSSVAKQCVEYADVNHVFDHNQAVALINAISMEARRDWAWKVALSNPIIQETVDELQDSEISTRLGEALRTGHVELVDETVTNARFLKECVMEVVKKNPMAAERLTGDTIVLSEPTPDTIDSVFERLKTLGLPIFRKLLWNMYPDSWLCCVLNYLGYTNVFLVINILEAAVTDLLNGRGENGFVGLFLILTIPFVVFRSGKNGPESVMSTEWCQLYNAWNAAFVLNTIDIDTRVWIMSKLVAIQSEPNPKHWLSLRSTTLMSTIGQNWRRRKTEDLPVWTPISDLEHVGDRIAHHAYAYSLYNADRIASSTWFGWRWLVRGFISAVQYSRNS
jgi:hypothetical protein